MPPVVKHGLFGAAVAAILSAVVLCWRDGVGGALSSWDIWAATIAIGALTATLACTMMRQPPAQMAERSPDAEPPLVDRPALSPPKRKRSARRMQARLTAQLRWLALSPGLGRFLRRKPAALRRQSLFQVVHPEDVPLVDRAFQEALATRHKVAAEFRVVVLTQAMVPQAVSATALATVPASNAHPKPSDTDELPAAQQQLVRHVRLLIVPHRKHVAQPLELHCRFRDITRRARAEAAYKLTRAKYSLSKERLATMRSALERLKESYFELYHNAPVMYFSLDAGGRLVTFNDTLVRTLGYDREELSGRSYAELVAPVKNVSKRDGDAAGVPNKPRMTSLLAPFRAPAEIETLWRTKAGATLDIWIRSVPVVDEAGKFVRSRGAALDLTERNRLANELRARGDELERTNERLRGKNAELEDFTHVVSHDLKEPLRTLLAYSNILAEDHSAQLGPDGFQYINHLIQASRRLGNLIDDLLALGQAGRSKGAPQIFDFIETVATVRSDLVGLIQRKEATILTEGSLPTVAGDPQRITQLLTNLVTNGLKYNNNPTPQVVIGHVSTENPGAAMLPGPVPGSAPAEVNPDHAIIYVRDNGIGIDPQYHDKIFGIFRRLHQPNEYEGTGAGLAICKKIVESHDGTIWVESELGKGATFYFTLPRPPQSLRGQGPASQAKSATASMRTSPPKPSPQAAAGKLAAGKATSAAPNAAAPKARAPAPRTVKDRVSTETIRQRESTRQTDKGATAAAKVLLVEDHVDMAMIIQRLCAKSGLPVHYFTNAEEAWEYLGNETPDLLLLDINLPGMSGIDLCRKVRQELGRVAVPIVLFSPERDDEALRKLHEAGADFVLSKDLLTQPAVWQQKITEILAAGRGASLLYASDPSTTREGQS